MLERLVYLILGSRGAGRFEVVADLVDFGLAKEDAVQVFASESDAESWEAPPSIRNEKCVITQFKWNGLEEGLTLDPESEVLFVVADGLSDPSDFVEAFFAWIRSVGFELGRVITVADCARIYAEKRLLPWYDCCIHFSDVVLLNQRQDVPNKWIDEFKARYQKQYYPCLFEFVKKGKLTNPYLALEPQARRISKLFDDPDDYSFVDRDNDYDDYDEDDAMDEEEEEEFEGGDPTKDPFLARLPNGHRVRPVPDISKLIDFTD